MVSALNYSELLDGINEFMKQTIDKKIDHMGMLYSVSDTKEYELKTLGSGSMSMLTPWNGTVNYDTISKGFAKNFTQRKFSTGLELDERIMKFHEWDPLKPMTEEKADAVYTFIQTYGASVFMHAADVNYAGGDAVALCSTSHDLSPSNGAHQDNYAALDLTIANVETLEKRAATFTNDRGDINPLIPNTILVGPSGYRTAQKIFGSDKEAFVGDNTYNPFKTDYQILKNPYISDNRWFIVDGSKMKKRLQWKWGERPNASGATETDFDTGIYKVKIECWMDFGWTNWDWIIGSFPA